MVGHGSGSLQFQIMTFQLFYYNRAFGKYHIIKMWHIMKALLFTLRIFSLGYYYLYCKNDLSTKMSFDFFKKQN